MESNDIAIVKNCLEKLESMPPANDKQNRIMSIDGCYSVVYENAAGRVLKSADGRVMIVRTKTVQ